MNQYRVWLPVMMVCLVLACTNGCTKRPKAAHGAGGLDTDRIDVMESDMYGADYLPGRPDESGRNVADGQSPFEPVYFPYDSSQVAESERFKLDQVADHLRKNQNEGMILEGHTDERGSREYNVALGERRALAIRAYLIGTGIDGNRIQTRSYGEENPVAFGHDDGSWSLNRRGEFVLFY